MLQSKDAREDHGDYISSRDSAFSCWLTTKVVKNDCRKLSCVERRETISVSADGRLAIPARPLIVVVDDEPHIAITLAEILERRGYFTVWFTEPTAACAFMETTRPDLLLNDVNMLSLDGLDLACCLRRKHKMPGEGYLGYRKRPATGAKDRSSGWFHCYGEQARSDSVPTPTA